MAFLRFLKVIRSLNKIDDALHFYPHLRYHCCSYLKVGHHKKIGYLGPLVDQTVPVQHVDGADRRKKENRYPPSYEHLLISELLDMIYCVRTMYI